MALPALALAGLVFVVSQPCGRQASVRFDPVVVTYHPAATEIGMKILQSGGNAFDAFVGATMAEYVIAEGLTNMAGALAVLVYDASSNNTK
jgi:gamma-glutamyltranspeptidase